MRKLILCCIIFSTWVSVNSDDCQRFCTLSIYSSDLHSLSEKYHWCDTYILINQNRDQDNEDFLKIVSESIKTNAFFNTTIYIMLPHGQQKYSFNETIDFLKVIDGIYVNFYSNLTYFDELKSHLPHLKLIMDLWKGEEKAIEKYNENPEKYLKADYFAMNENMNISNFPGVDQEKILYFADDFTFYSEKKVKKFFEGVKNIELVEIEGWYHTVSFDEKAKIFDAYLQCSDKRIVNPVYIDIVPQFIKDYIIDGRCHCLDDTYENDEVINPSGSVNVYTCQSGKIKKTGCKVDDTILAAEHVMYVNNTLYFCPGKEKGVITIPLTGCTHKDGKLLLFNETFTDNGIVYNCSFTVIEGIYKAVIAPISCNYDGKIIPLLGYTYVHETKQFIVCEVDGSSVLLHPATPQQIDCIWKSDTYDCRESNLLISLVFA